MDYRRKILCYDAIFAKDENTFRSNAQGLFGFSGFINWERQEGYHDAGSELQHLQRRKGRKKSKSAYSEY